MPITCDITLSTGLNQVGTITVEVPANVAQDPRELDRRMASGMRAFIIAFGSGETPCLGKSAQPPAAPTS